jgi:hypothetical protein
MERLYARMRRVRNEQFRNNRWLLLHDNAPAHCALNLKQFLASKSVFVIQHPPTRQIWHRQTFFLFPKVKLALKGNAFQRHKRHPTRCDRATERGFIAGLPARFQGRV